MGQTIHQTLWSLVCEENIVLCIYGFYIILRKRGQRQRPLPTPHPPKITKLFQNVWHVHKQAHLIQTWCQEKASQLRPEVWKGTGERFVADRRNSLGKYHQVKIASSPASGIKFSIANELKMKKDKLGKWLI